MDELIYLNQLKFQMKLAFETNYEIPLRESPMKYPLSVCRVYLLFFVLASVTAA